jgi:8-oxo-dGTP diphosphatase
MRNIEVVAAIIVQNGLVFAAQRQPKGEVGLKWEFPGGKIEPDETAEAALVRELEEELGIQVAVNTFLMTVSHQYETFYLTMHCYLASIMVGSITLHEHLDSRWLSLDELDSVDWAPADVAVVEHLKIHLDDIETR